MEKQNQKSPFATLKITLHRILAATVKYQRKGEKFQRQVHPLFPRNLFVQLNPVQGPLRQVNNKRGMALLIRLSTLPSVVPESSIVELLAR